MGKQDDNNKDDDKKQAPKKKEVPVKFPRTHPMNGSASATANMQVGGTGSTAETVSTDTLFASASGDSSLSNYSPHSPNTHGSNVMTLGGTPPFSSNVMTLCGTPPLSFTIPKSKTKSPTSNSRLDTIHIRVVKCDEDGVSGFALHFLPKSSARQTGPWSAKLMKDLVDAGTEFPGNLIFESAIYKLKLPDGTWPEYSGKREGDRFPGRVFVCFAEIQGLLELHYREIAGGIIGMITREQATNWQGGKAPCEIPINTADFLDMNDKVWSDIMGHDAAYETFKERNGPIVFWTGWVHPTQEQMTWGKEHLSQIAAYFRMGSVPHNICLPLGLPREWDAEPGVPVNHQDDNLVDGERNEVVDLGNNPDGDALLENQNQEGNEHNEETDV